MTCGCARLRLLSQTAATLGNSKSSGFTGVGTLVSLESTSRPSGERIFSALVLPGVGIDVSRCGPANRKGAPNLNDLVLHAPANRRGQSLFGHYDGFSPIHGVSRDSILKPIPHLRRLGL